MGQKRKTRKKVSLRSTRPFHRGLARYSPAALMQAAGSTTVLLILPHRQPAGE
jgi:hypothetical protein